MENIKAKTLLVVVCVLMAVALLFMVRHDRSKTKISSEMKTGIKALTDPESLIKD